MATITPTLLTALLTGFKKNFQGGMSLVEPTYTQIASVISSSTKSNTYGWIGEMPGFREWIGDRVINDIGSHGYAIENKDWEMSIGVDRNDIEDDQLGVYAPLFQEMGRATNVHPDELVYALLKAGTATECYDGQNFFDPEHPVNSKHDGTGAVTPVSNMTDGNGKGWYILDTSRAIKPIIFQQRKKPQFVAMDKPDDEESFMRKKYRYGVDSRSNVGFGFWQMARMSKAELNGENLNKEIAAMQSIKGDGGRPLALNPTLLVCDPSNRKAALETVKAERNAAGATNVNRNAVDVLVVPHLA